jgi:hypothetical protein
MFDGEIAHDSAPSFGCPEKAGNRDANGAEQMPSSYERVRQEDFFAKRDGCSSPSSLSQLLVDHNVFAGIRAILESR